MITLNAKINLNYDKTVTVQSAKSNIPDSNGNYSLSTILNSVSATPFIGTVPSQRNGAFYDNVNAETKTFWQKGSQQTYTFSGRQMYNNTSCMRYEIAYVADFTLCLPYANNVELHQVVLENKWKNKVFYEYITNLQGGAVGLLVKVFIPLEVIAGDDIESPQETFPDVMVYATASRPNRTIGKVYEISVVTDKPTTSLELVFDQANNYHPTRVEIDGATFPVNKAIFSTDSLPFTNEHTIKIYDWNNPRSNFFIYGISSHLVDWTNIDYRVMTNCEISIFDRGDTNKPSWGIYSNGGTLSFNDIYGIVEEFADKQLLVSNIPVEFWITNTLTGKRQKVGEMYTAKWNYDSDNRTVNVTVKDDLEEWQDITISGFDYDPRYPDKVLPSQSMQNIYHWLYKRTPEKYHMNSFANLDNETQNILANTYIKYPLLESGNLWQQWNKICKVAQGHIFKNTDGITMFVYNGGN